MKPHLCAACDEPIDRECGVLDGGDLYHESCWESLTAKDREREADDAEDRVLGVAPGTPWQIHAGDKAMTDTALAILRDLLKEYDDESGTIRVGDDAGCIECTVGTVPNSLNKGLCAFHRARAALAGAQP